MYVCILLCKEATTQVCNSNIHTDDLYPRENICFQKNYQKRPLFHLLRKTLLGLEGGWTLDYSLNLDQILESGSHTYWYLTFVCNIITKICIGYMFGQRHSYRGLVNFSV